MSDVNETSGSASVFVRLADSSGELTFDIAVTIETIGGGTATGEFIGKRATSVTSLTIFLFLPVTVVIDDYTAATVIRTFTSGSNFGSPAQSLDIPIVNDNLEEPTETIFVRGSESDPSARFSNGGNSDTATVNILNDDGNYALS